ncbi:MAG: 4-hydroxy-3-methylbut-2-enyl diphosphate reductase [Kiritimatiellia bacterium]
MAQSKRVIVASPRGFCAGVRHAIEIAEVTLRVFPRPVYCLKELVHNEYVLDELRRKGMVFVQTLSEIPEGATVVISAHGVPPGTYKEAEARYLRVIDATCPFVRKVHEEVRRFALAGYTVLLIGHPDHDEVVGVVGEAPERVIVIKNAEEISDISVPDPQRVAVVTQTTLSFDETARLLELLRLRFPALITPTGDICYATINRQDAVKRLSRTVQAILVLGATNSSNARRLVEVARTSGVASYLVNDVARLSTLPLDDYNVIGLTAAASTPESLVEGALDVLGALGFTNVEYMTLVEEAVHFVLPKTLRERLREMYHSES